MILWLGVEDGPQAEGEAGHEAGGYCSKPGMMVGVRIKERRYRRLDSGAIFNVEPTGFGWNVSFERTGRVGAVLKSFEVFFGAPLCLKCH